jgi:NOL1/NOP2/fmu family ribosome biogenesis protein
VEQTSGADLPKPVKVYGDVGENYDRLLTFLERQGIELVFTENIAPALGASYGGRIAILLGQSKAETFTTLLHELGHELLMHASRRTTTTKTVREAEAVAFVVGKAIGLEMASASADYIALYHGNASLLAESLEVVQQTSAVILAALENPFEQKAQEESTTEPARESRRTRRNRPQPADAEASESLAEVA